MYGRFYLKKIISLAYYLPQFHEIPENNLWWGTEFTEWVNLREARQYYPWQELRRPVAPFNEYNLLNSEVLDWQSRIASDHGITGFLIWDYWFGDGKQLLERPAELILEKCPDFRYCFSWANHSWENKTTHQMLQEQKYLGEEDYTAYFYKRLPHFKSDNYIKVDGKPVFGVFLPQGIPDLPCFVEVFRRLAELEGFPGIYLIAENSTEDSLGLFDRYLSSNSAFQRRKASSPVQFVKEQLIKRYNWNALGPIVFDFNKTALPRSADALSKHEIPVLFTGWDTTPRHKKRGTIYRGFTLEAFKQTVLNVVAQLKLQQAEHPIVIVKSWNEWAEGNLMEPDSVFGDGLLKIYKDNVPPTI